MAEEKERKKFRDTKVGLFLKDKAPKILETVGDVLPDKGVLGVVKNLIDKSDELNPKLKEMAIEKLIESYEIEVSDRISAREREIELSKASRHDILFHVTGLIGLGVFCFIVFAIAFLKVPDENKEVWIHLIGICEGVVLSIFGYYFGSAMKKNVQ